MVLSALTTRASGRRAESVAEAVVVDDGQARLAGGLLERVGHVEEHFAGHRIGCGLFARR
jgi:hypothetical protein